MHRTKKDCNATIDRLQPGAERELAAYALAVRQLFGSDVARHSIDDWMHDLESMDWPGQDAIPDWRYVTISAAVRLAGRLNLQTSILHQLIA